MKAKIILGLMTISSLSVGSWFVLHAEQATKPKEVEIWMGAQRVQRPRLRKTTPPSLNVVDDQAAKPHAEAAAPASEATRPLPVAEPKADDAQQSKTTNAPSPDKPSLRFYDQSPAVPHHSAKADQSQAERQPETTTNSVSEELDGFSTDGSEQLPWGKKPAPSTTPPKTSNHGMKWQPKRIRPRTQHEDTSHSAIQALEFQTPAALAPLRGTGQLTGPSGSRQIEKAQALLLSSNQLIREAVDILSNLQTTTGTNSTDEAAQSSMPPHESPLKWRSIDAPDNAVSSTQSETSANRRASVARRDSAQEFADNSPKTTHGRQPSFIETGDASGTTPRMLPPSIDAVAASSAETNLTQPAHVGIQRHDAFAVANADYLVVESSPVKSVAATIPHGGPATSTRLNARIFWCMAAVLVGTVIVLRHGRSLADALMGFARLTLLAALRRLDSPAEQAAPAEEELDEEGKIENEFMKNIIAKNVRLRSQIAGSP